VNIKILACQIIGPAAAGSPDPFLRPWNITQLGVRDRAKREVCSCALRPYVEKIEGFEIVYSAPSNVKCTHAERGGIKQRWLGESKLRS